MDVCSNMATTAKGASRANPATAFQTHQDMGYWKLSRLFSDHPEVAVLRSFGQLNMMNLLRLQAELHDLEEELEETRQEDRESGDTIRQRYGVSFREMRDNAQDGDAIQYELLENIGRKLGEYSTSYGMLSTLFKERKLTAIDCKRSGFTGCSILTPDGPSVGSRDQIPEALARERQHG